MVVDGAAMLLSHSSTSLCRGTFGSGAQPLAATASPLQRSPEETSQHRGYCLGTRSSVVLLREKRDILHSSLWDCVSIPCTSIQWQRSPGINCLCHLHLLLVGWLVGDINSATIEDSFSFLVSSSLRQRKNGIK